MQQNLLKIVTEYYENHSEQNVKITKPANLVGGFNPFEKYARKNGFIFPKIRGEH